MAGSDRFMDCQTEAFPLEGKVANAMSRMRCSHHSGVTFLAMITAIAWPTPHHRLWRSLSSRRSLWVAVLSYMCKKLSFPHPSRCSLDTFSRLGEGFYSCALCKKLGFSHQLSLSAKSDYRAQPPPRGTLIVDQRRACAARPRGKAGSERRKACFHPGGSGFHLPRGLHASPALKPNSINFYVHNTGSLLLSSLKKVTFPSSLLPRPSSSSLSPLLPR